MSKGYWFYNFAPEGQRALFTLNVLIIGWFKKFLNTVTNSFQPLMVNLLLIALYLITEKSFKLTNFSFTY